ncbi:MGDG synthase family glycosyltransferase [Paenibacillus lutrae]|uniref:UDP-N-acetylglucosamine--LPS N-acetylglucosamine transferase n=1 Tax=Paenibacillus lutrae TaxID=2078573 RepID=A0A7X3FFK0_9BACL|nr:glycosyltransferase [Paenibacillus lutrae]MVO98739.1 UDP-N-acetylglucosamine--LPS N-acetylglucosamine transferase [Paenibacillus lutrae]
MRRKRVLLLSEGFGSGHTRAAYALSENLRQLHPGIQTRVMELGSFLHPTLARWVFSAYRKTVSSQPKLYGKLYRFQYKKPLNPLTQLALHRIFYAQTSQLISRLQPDTIVCTHPFPSIVVSRLKRAGLNVPLCTVITDYDVHGTWISPEVNKYLVSSQQVKIKLMKRGVDQRRIDITGIPVHPSFRQSPDKEDLRLRLGLNPLPTVMVMGGGWGLIGSDTLLTSMTQWKEELQFIFCFGNNGKALERCMQDSRFQHPNIKLIGYTNEIDKLMEVSDLLVTKPGGMTCSEGLAKGIPMLFYEPIPGQEEKNMQFFIESGCAELIKREETIHRRFKELTEYGAELQEQREMKRRNAQTGWESDYSAIIWSLLQKEEQQSV